MAVIEPGLAAWRGPQLARKVSSNQPLRDVREIVNAILYVNRTGCAWEYLPHDFPPMRRSRRTVVDIRLIRASAAAVGLALEEDHAVTRPAPERPAPPPAPRAHHNPSARSTALLLQTVLGGAAASATTTLVTILCHGLVHMRW